MRTRLQIEYHRLLAWCEVAQLVEHKDGEDLPDSLNAERFVLVAILTEIRSLMEDFADINGRYVQLRPDKGLGAEEDAIESKLVEEVKEISLSYEKRAAEKKYPRGTNHIACATIRVAAMAKEIVKNPRCRKWIAFDENVFISLLKRLTELNDYLHDLMHGYQARELEKMTHMAYLEMVQVRTSVENLNHLVTAAMLLGDWSLEQSPHGDTRRRADKALASLAKFKILRAANDAPAGQKPPEYDSIMNSTRLEYADVQYDAQDLLDTSPAERGRVTGKFYCKDHPERHVWIEWKTYKSRHDSRLKKDVPVVGHVKRVKELVALLQSEKPEEFCTPRCLGYFDDRDDSENSIHDQRFGLVFEKPDQADIGRAPISLEYLIRNKPTPSLTERIALAHKIATCVLYFHAVNWLYKSLRSDSVIFFSRDKETLFTHPYLSGFEYARPDRAGETTSGGDLQERLELYVHPDYQGWNARGSYRKTFDIYSLGIIFLEIAYWKPIEAIIGIDPENATSEDLRSIRHRLLNSQSEYLRHVGASVGERYHDAVRCCIVGRKAFGIGDEEDEKSIDTGTKLQEGFTRLVVGALEGISL